MASGVVQMRITGMKKLKKGLARLEPVTNKKVNNLLHGIAVRSSNEMKRLIREARFSKTGKLEKAIRIRKITKGWMVETRGVGYAGYVHDGTRPHEESFPVGSKGDRLAKGWRGNIKSKFQFGGRRIHRHPGASTTMARTTYQFMPRGYRVGMKDFNRRANRTMKDAINLAFA